MAGWIPGIDRRAQDLADEQDTDPERVTVTIVSAENGPTGWRLTGALGRLVQMLRGGRR